MWCREIHNARPTKLIQLSSPAPTNFGRLDNEMVWWYFDWIILRFSLANMCTSGSIEIHMHRKRYTIIYNTHNTQIYIVDTHPLPNESRFTTGGIRPDIQHIGVLQWNVFGFMHMPFVLSENSAGKIYNLRYLVVSRIPPIHHVAMSLTNINKNNKKRQLCTYKYWKYTMKKKVLKWLISKKFFVTHFA